MHTSSTVAVSNTVPTYNLMSMKSAKILAKNIGTLVIIF